MKAIWPVVFVTLMLAFMTTVWMNSGTIPSLMYYGLKSINPRFILPLCFVLTSATSMVLGSATGAISTMGVVLMGVARGLGLPAAPVAGAIVSGGIVGDRSSLTSGQFHLVAAMTSSDPALNFYRFMFTGLPCFVLSVLGYCWTGRSMHVTQATSSPILPAIQEVFHPSLLLLLPPVLLIGLSLLKIPLKWVFASGIVSGAVLAVWIRGVRLSSVILDGFIGYDPDTGFTLLDQLLKSGGLRSTIELATLLLSAGALNGMLEEAGVVDQLLGNGLRSIRGEIQLRLATMGLSTLVAVVSCSQSLAVIVPARALLPEYQKRRLSGWDLARVIDDSGAILTIVIPWTGISVMASLMLGVSTWEYTRYAFYVLLQPVVSLLISQLESARRGSSDGARIRFPLYRGL